MVPKPRLAAVDNSFFAVSDLNAPPSFWQYLADTTSLGVHSILPRMMRDKWGTSCGAISASAISDYNI